MIARLGFDIRADERRLVASAAAAITATGAAAALVASAADALFLARVGAAHLGLGLAVSSALLIPVLGAVGALADRAERGRMLVGLCLVAAVVLVGLGGLAAALPAVGGVLALVLGKQVAAAVDLTFWVLVAERLDARQSRRLVPLMLAAQGLGAVAGAFAVGPLVRLAGSAGAMALGACGYGLAAWASRGLARADGPRRLVTPPARTTELSAWHTVQTSALARHLAVIVAVAGMFAPILYYLLGAAAAAELRSEAALAAFFGQYRGIVQGLTLVAQLAVAPLLLGRIGVAPALLAAPAGAVAAAAALGASAELAVIAIAQASARVLDAAVETPAEKLTHNLLAPEVRGRIAGFVDGVAKRAGAVAGGVAASLLVAWPDALRVLLGILAVVWLAVAMRLRRRFADLAVAELAAPGRHGAPALGPILGPRMGPIEDVELLADDRALALLRAALVQHQDAERRALALELLTQLGERGRADAAAELARAAAHAAQPGPLVRALVEYLEHHGEPALVTHRSTHQAVAHAMVQVLERNTHALRDARADAVRVLGLVLASCLAAEHGIRWQNGARDVPALLARLEALSAGELGDPVTLAARIALARLSGEAVLALIDLGLGSGVAAAERVALDELCTECARLAADAPMAVVLEHAWMLMRALRRRRSRLPSSQAAAARGLARLLERGGRPATSTDDVVRSAELVLLRSEAGTLARRWLEEHAPAPQRARAIELLCAAAGAAEARVLAAHLGDDDPAVRQTAAAALATLSAHADAQALGALVAASRFGRRRARQAALAVLRDIRVSDAALDELIAAELGAMDRTLARLGPLAELGGEAGALLIRRMEERVDEAAHVVLTVLQARLGMAAVGAAGERYVRAPDPAARARALEALDTALPRALATPLLSALEPGAPAERSRRAAGRLSEPVDLDSAIEDELGSGDPLARALLLHALGQDGRASHRQAITAAAQSAARAADPLDIVRRIIEADPQPHGTSGRNAAIQDNMPSRIETAMTLRRLPLFAELSTRQLGELAAVVRWHSVAAGEVIVRQGEAGDAMYILAAGRARVEMTAADGSVHPVGALAPGEPFGEMALFEGTPRSATVIATERGRVGRIDRADFEALVDEIPAMALAICRVLSRRVREGNQSAAEPRASAPHHEEPHQESHQEPST